MHELTFQNSIGFNEFVYLIILRFYKIQLLFLFLHIKFILDIFFHYWLIINGLKQSAFNIE